MSNEGNLEKSVDTKEIEEFIPKDLFPEGYIISNFECKRNSDQRPASISLFVIYDAQYPKMNIPKGSSGVDLDRNPNGNHLSDFTFNNISYSIEYQKKRN